jgi:hypothetical protein
MSAPSDSVKEAMLYEKLSDGSVRCNLCAHRCVIAQASAGFVTSRRTRMEACTRSFMVVSSLSMWTR